MSVITKLQRTMGLTPRKLPEPPPDDIETLTDLSSPAPRDLFHTRAAALGDGALVLEVGTKRVQPDTATHSFVCFPHVPRHQYVMADIEPGIDVDVVADLHALPPEWTQRFDAFVAAAVFEHLERPWVAAAEVARILKPGGICYINTHQTFPLHGFPSDFFRFSKEALALIFRDAGLSVIDVAYENRSMIIAHADVVPKGMRRWWNERWPSYVNVHLLAEKGVR